MARLNSSKGFKARVANYMTRNSLHSSRGVGQNGRSREESFASARLQLKKKLVLFPVKDIFSSDEFAVLCRSFPGHAIRSTRRPATYERVKDRLTAIFLVFADGRKGPLVLIGTSKRLRTFPRLFDALHDFGVF